MLQAAFELVPGFYQSHHRFAYKTDVAKDELEILTMPVSSTGLNIVNKITTLASIAVV